MSPNETSVDYFKKAMNVLQNQYEEDTADNYILRCKNAVVIWYQPMTLIACIKFCEDKNENEYHLYNRCCAYLEAGDIVKVYYTTNAAKGWIAVRCGKPNYLNEYGQKIIDINSCCGDDDDDENTENICCDESCCNQAATQHKDKETVIIEEWTERIEGTEEEIREYEENNANSPFNM